MYAKSHEPTTIVNQSITIDELQIVPVKPTDGIVGFASFVLNNSIYLGSVAIVSRPSGGYRLLYPTKKIGGTSMDIFHPINRIFAERVERAVLAKYEDVMNAGTNRETIVPQ